MPHVTIEYSADIDDSHDIHALCVAIFDALAVHPTVSGPASLKVRARPSAYWRTGTDPQSFAHAQLLALPGRDDAVKTSMVQTILHCMTAALPDVGSLTVDYGDLSPYYAKRDL